MLYDGKSIQELKAIYFEVNVLLRNKRVQAALQMKAKKQIENQKLLFLVSQLESQLTQPNHSNVIIDDLLDQIEGFVELLA
jgi:uncharacterized membrane-anchored protein YjiN (DUF445 family)